jgi:hypothetical protein
LDRLKFIRHSRELGFSIDDIRSLLALAAHPESPCGQADAIAKAQLQDVERKIEMLEGLRTALKRMVSACKSGRVHECRIIETLADHGLCATDHMVSSKLTNSTKRTTPRKLARSSRSAPRA